MSWAISFLSWTFATFLSREKYREKNICHVRAKKYKADSRFRGKDGQEDYLFLNGDEAGAKYNIHTSCPAPTGHLLFEEIIFFKNFATQISDSRFRGNDV